MTFTRTLPGPDDTHAFGVRLGALLGRGDLVILTGALGAGKTALAKGIGAGLDVAGTVMSPTFVIARHHRARIAGGTPLVHVDAYRLGGRLEFDDLDLDTDLTDAAVVVEWGEEAADRLAEDRVLIALTRHDDDTRTAQVSATGPRSQAIVDALAAG